MIGFWILLLRILLLLIALLIPLIIIIRCYFNKIFFNSNFTCLNFKSVLGKSTLPNVPVTSWRRAYACPDVNSARRARGQKMAPKLQRFISPGKGNGLRATARIEEGELVYVTEPLAYCVSQKQSRNVCHQCFTRWDRKTFFFALDLIWLSHARFQNLCCYSLILFHFLKKFTCDMHVMLKTSFQNQKLPVI